MSIINNYVHMSETEWTIFITSRKGYTVADLKRGSTTKPPVTKSVKKVAPSTTKAKKIEVSVTKDATKVTPSTTKVKKPQPSVTKNVVKKPPLTKAKKVVPEVNVT